MNNIMFSRKTLRRNKIKATTGERIFSLLIYIILTLLACCSLLPIINILAVSLSSKYAAGAGMVSLFPVEFTLSSYKFAMQSQTFTSTFWVSIERVLIGVPVNIVFLTMCSYPLSLKSKDFPGRTYFSWFFMISIIFSGGLIPTFMTIKIVGLIDNFWVLIIPLALPVYYMILMRNFFQQIPYDIVEAAKIDGAGHWKILWSIYFPISKTGVATMVLLCFIMHWNTWFDGLLYIGRSSKQPLQTYLQTILSHPIDVNSLSKSPEQWKIVQFVSDRTLKSAQIFIATIPIMVIYPFAQKYFTKGMLVGAVKG